MKTIVKYLLLLFVSLNAFCQNGITGNKKWYIKPVINYGFILQHRLAIGDLIKGWAPMLELNIVKPANGSKLWHLENNKPEVGLVVNIIGFRNPEVLGQSIAVAPFAEIPLSKKERPSRLYMRLSWGVAYLTKRFDADNNHKNIAIGSHWNSFVGFRWFWQLNISNKLRLEPGISLSHVSNGRAKVPNLGLNLVSFNLGLNYKLIDTEDKPGRVDSNTVAPSRHEFLTWYSFGYDETGNPEGPKYLAHTLSLNYYYNKSNKNKFGIGADIFYEELYLLDLKEKNISTPTAFDKIRIGPKLAYAYSIGRVSLPVEMGYYVGAKISPEGPFFHRLGVRYTGKNGLVVQFGLKTHFGVAYHFDYGIGYRLPFAKKKHVKD